MNPDQAPIFSEGADLDQLSGDVASLLGDGKWVLSDDRKGIEKRYQFKGFKKAWQFMNLVADDCKKLNHHPEWSNIYNKTHIRWTTHSPSGLSAKDIQMARVCDTHAESLGGAAITETMKAESSAALGMEAGDCCIPKKATETKV